MFKYMHLVVLKFKCLLALGSCFLSTSSLASQEITREGGRYFRAMYDLGVSQVTPDSRVMIFQEAFSSFDFWLMIVLGFILLISLLLVSLIF